MAHIERRVRKGKDGAAGTIRWRARYRVPGGRERSKSFAKKSDAERWLAIQTADVAKGAWVDPSQSRITFGDWVERWERRWSTCDRGRSS